MWKLFSVQKFFVELTLDIKRTMVVIKIKNLDHNSFIFILTSFTLMIESSIYMNWTEPLTMTHTETWASRLWVTIDDVIIYECTLIDQENYFKKKMNDIQKEKKRSTSHIAEWLIYSVGERDTGSNPVRSMYFFFVLSH